MTRLFVIGNGFDRAHGLNTSYNDFKNFLLADYSEINIDEFILPEAQHMPDGGIEYNDYEVLSMIVYTINEAEGSIGQWKDLENSLGRLNFDEAFDRVEPYIDKDGDVDFYKTAYMMEDIASDLVAPVVTIQHLFAEWVSTINIKSSVPKEDFKKLIRKKDVFLTFNYTETLEEAYGISEEYICHIHGMEDRKIYFGHGDDEDKTDFHMQKYTGSQDGLNTITQQLRKKTNEAYQENQWFFEHLKKLVIKEVYSFGFSYSEVDMIYFRKIFENLVSEEVKWNFNDFDIEFHESYKKTLRNSGFKGIFSSFHIEK